MNFKFGRKCFIGDKNGKSKEYYINYIIYDC